MEQHSTFTDEGSIKFYDTTSANIGKRIYIVYDGEVVSAPNVKTAQQVVQQPSQVWKHMKQQIILLHI